MLAFKPPADASARAKVLLIGPAGAGKTHAALTFPKPAVIDAEGSIGWFKDRFAFDAVATKSYSDVRDLIRQVRANPSGYETIVIDSLTTVYNGLINVASQGRIKRKFSQLLDELYYQLPMHVVCIGWIKAEYAKAGSVVGGKTVKDNDMIVLGEQFDGDKKTEHAFDFIFKIDGNNGKKTRAVVLKSRSGQFAKGSVIEDFGWSTLAPLFSGRTETLKRGMTDEEQVSYDADALDDQLPSGKQILERAKTVGVAMDGASFWDWAIMAADVERGKLDEGSKRAILRALAEAASEKRSAPPADVIEDVAPPKPVTLPKELTDAANALGILPRNIDADLRKLEGDVTGLTAMYLERVAKTQQAQAPEPVLPADELGQFLDEHCAPKPAVRQAVRGLAIEFGRPAAKTMFPTRESKLAFAVEIIKRNITSTNDLFDEEIILVGDALRERIATSGPVNTGDFTCGNCSAPPGTPHFSSCDIAA